MEIISALVLGYCAKRIYGILKDRDNTNSNHTSRYVRASPARPTTREQVQQEISRTIKKNQQSALDNMGPEGSLDPAAEIWARRRQESFISGWENDPRVIEIQKELRVKFNQRKEESWAYKVGST